MLLAMNLVWLGLTISRVPAITRVSAVIWASSSGVMSGCLVMVIALFAGLAAFTVVGVRKGYKLKEIGKMGAGGLKDALLVVEIMFVIGFITAIWRASGTITFFVYYGIRFITPGLFLIITFLLSCLLSYALGTSFGVAGTVGVIFIALARSGNVNEVITAGVVMGAFLLSSGTKGKRYALPNAEIMIHQPLGGSQGQASDIQIQTAWLLKTKEKLNRILSENTGKDLAVIEKDTDRDNFMGAEEACEYGLIDKVITSR